MKLIEPPRQTETKLPDAEALIEEARQRQRKRWLFIGIVVIIVAVGSGIWAVTSGRTETKAPSPSNTGPTKSVLTVQECAPSQLSFNLQSWMNPSQLTFVTDVQLVNASPSPCKLWGYPKVIVSDRGHGSVPERVTDLVPLAFLPGDFHPAATRSSAVVVGPRKAAAFYMVTDIDQSVIADGKCSGLYTLAIRLPRWTAPLAEDKFGLATCPGTGVSVSAVGLQPRPESPPAQS
jgi:hypothetical protein